MVLETAILTVFFGGVVSGVVTHFLATGRAERDLLRQKLEQLFTAVHANRLTIMHEVFQWLPQMRGEALTAERQAQIAQDDDHIRSLAMKGEVQPRDEAVLLLTLYFPQLRIVWDRIERHRIALQDMAIQFDDTYSPTPGNVPWKFLDQYHSAIHAMNEEHAQFRSAVYQEIQNINSKWFWYPSSRP